MVEITTTTLPVKQKPGYRTPLCWLTLASVLEGSSFLFGVIGSETKDSLTSALQHGVESLFLIGGQFFMLCRYIKSRKEAKVAEEVKKQKEDHERLIEKLKLEQAAIMEAQLITIKAEYEAKLAEAKKKKPTTRRKRPNG
mgnify:FL=1